MYTEQLGPYVATPQWWNLMWLWRSLSWRKYFTIHLHQRFCTTQQYVVAIYWCPILDIITQAQLITGLVENKHVAHFNLWLESLVADIECINIEGWFTLQSLLTTYSSCICMCYVYKCLDILPVVTYVCRILCFQSLILTSTLLKGDVWVDNKCHIILATDYQLQLLAHSHHWLVSCCTNC